MGIGEISGGKGIFGKKLTAGNTEIAVLLPDGFAVNGGVIRTDKSAFGDIDRATLIVNNSIIGIIRNSFKSQTSCTADI